MTLLDIRPRTSFAGSSFPNTSSTDTSFTDTPHRTAPETPAPNITAGHHLRAVPAGSATEARGFVLYVGIDETKATANGTDLALIVQALKQFTATLAPGSETYAAVALAPRGVGGRDVDVVRLALQDPAAVAQRDTSDSEKEAAETSDGVVIDFSRRRVTLDGSAAALTHTEFALLQYLVHNTGRTIARAELIGALWRADLATASASTGGHHPGDPLGGRAGDIPNERTIDVHVRRLRAKLGSYEEIVRTVRGIGYRFDQHADVTVQDAATLAPALVAQLA